MRGSVISRPRPRADGPRSPSEGTVGGLRDGYHVAAAIPVSPDGADGLTELQVRLGLHDPFHGKNGVETADAGDAACWQRPRLSGEEADRKRLRELRQRELVGNVLAQSLQDRDVHHVDADRMPHEVGHLASGDTSRDLDHDYTAVGRCDELWERDAVVQPERTRRLRRDLPRSSQLLAVDRRWVDVDPAHSEPDPWRTQAVGEGQERRLARP
jgi:hypothetical protein